MPEVHDTHKTSSATAKVGAALGGVGTGLGVLNMLGGAATLLGGCNPCAQPYAQPCAQPYGRGGYGGWGEGCAPEDHFVTRYDAAKDEKIAKLESEAAFRDANAATDVKVLELYKYVDSKLSGVERELSKQAVNNQAVKDSFQLAAERTEAQGRELRGMIECEAKDRRCADTILTTYMNATFYPKQIADVETSDDTTAQNTYNPLPIELCG